MAKNIIDRRQNDKGKSSDNRHRFVKRVKDQVREAVKDVIRDGDIKDIAGKKSKNVKIPGKGLKQPTFQHSKSGGKRNIVIPGNKDYVDGDRMPKPEEGGGQGGKDGSLEGEGEDAFEFSISREEFIDIFFEDLELPDMVKKDIAKTDEFIRRRAGFSVDGNPSRLNILRSMKEAKGRKLGLVVPKKKEIKALQEELAAINEQDDQSEDDLIRIEWIENRIAVLKKKIKAIPFMDDVDLRYNRWETVPIPSTQAVMFGIMDVSISMGEWEKEMAKRFFMLMYLFLDCNYQRVDCIWVRHHNKADEVDQDTFFHSHETGGTVVSSGLELVEEIIKDRYPPKSWNIFACQVSDGDNYRSDTPAALDSLRRLLNVVQYFAYVEVDQYGGRDSDLWEHYEAVAQSNKRLQMTIINDVKDIYPVFRGLFEKRD